MANWYSTSFKTTDKDILDVIKNGRTTDFYYDEKLEVGSCRLAWGICSIDTEKVEDIAKKHKSSFYIRSFDYLTETVEEWEYKDGIEILAESRHTPSEFKWEEVSEDFETESALDKS